MAGVRAREEVGVGVRGDVAVELGVAQVRQGGEIAAVVAAARVVAARLAAPRCVGGVHLPAARRAGAAVFWRHDLRDLRDLVLDLGAQVLKLLLPPVVVLHVVVRQAGHRALPGVGPGHQVVEARVDGVVGRQSRARPAQLHVPVVQQVLRQVLGAAELGDLAHPVAHHHLVAQVVPLYPAAVVVGADRLQLRLELRRRLRDRQVLLGVGVHDRPLRRLRGAQLKLLVLPPLVVLAPRAGVLVAPVRQARVLVLVPLLLRGGELRLVKVVDQRRHDVVEQHAAERVHRAHVPVVAEPPPAVVGEHLLVLLLAARLLQRVEVGLLVGFRHDGARAVGRSEQTGHLVAVLRKDAAELPVEPVKLLRVVGAARAVARVLVLRHLVHRQPPVVHLPHVVVVVRLVVLRHELGFPGNVLGRLVLIEPVPVAHRVVPGVVVLPRPVDAAYDLRVALAEHVVVDDELAGPAYVAAHLRAEAPVPVGDPDQLLAVQHAHFVALRKQPGVALAALQDGRVPRVAHPDTPELLAVDLVGVVRLEGLGVRDALGDEHREGVSRAQHCPRPQPVYGVAQAGDQFVQVVGRDRARRHQPAHLGELG